ncbi:hypothetical protein ACN469_43405 [Corallococcus terminator]
MEERSQLPRRAPHPLGERFTVSQQFGPLIHYPRMLGTIDRRPDPVTFLNLAQEQSVLAHAPDVKLFKTKKPDYDFLAFEKVERVIEAAAPQDLALLTTSPKTGLSALRRK